MIELSPLVATTRLSIGGRMNSPTLRMSLQGDALESLRVCLEKCGNALSEAADKLAEAAQDSSKDIAETLSANSKETVSLYREVIDVACGDGASGKVIKWIANGERVSDYDLALRLSAIVGWICEQYNSVFDGLSRQNIDA